MNIIKIKKHCMLLTLSVTFVMLTSCEKKTDWDLYDLKGKVKSYTEKHYKPVEKSGEWQQGEQSKGYGNYNIYFTPKGDYKQTDFYNENNELQEHIVAKKENGKIVEEAKYDINGDFIGKTVFTHLSDTKIEFISYNSDDKEVGNGKTLLKDGKFMQRNFNVLYNGEVRYGVEMKFLYDENGMPFKIEQSYPNGATKTMRFEYLEFDEQNNWTKRLDYTSEESETPEKIVIRTYEYY